jgi:uncharacterized protein (DUF433 family)
MKQKLSGQSGSNTGFREHQPVSNWQTGIPRGPKGIAKPPDRRSKFWRKAVDALNGDQSAAYTWMTTASASFGGKSPLQLTKEAKGRKMVMEELDRVADEMHGRTPQTGWRRCTALYPCSFNGELLFKGSKIPVRNLFYQFAEGGNIEGFLRENPTISRLRVDALLEFVILSLCDF